MNVPSLSERTLRRDIARGEISTGSEIQVLYRTVTIAKLSHSLLLIGYYNQETCCSRPRCLVVDKG